MPVKGSKGEAVASWCAQGWELADLRGWWQMQSKMAEKKMTSATSKILKSKNHTSWWSETASEQGSHKKRNHSLHGHKEAYNRKPKHKPRTNQVWRRHLMSKNNQHLSSRGRDHCTHWCDWGTGWWLEDGCFGHRLKPFRSLLRKVSEARGGLLLQ